jgi:hypothetical protein
MGGILHCHPSKQRCAVGYGGISACLCEASLWQWPIRHTQGNVIIINITGKLGVEHFRSNLSIDTLVSRRQHVKHADNDLSDHDGNTLAASVWILGYVYARPRESRHGFREKVVVAEGLHVRGSGLELGRQPRLGELESHNSCNHPMEGTPQWSWLCTSFKEWHVVAFILSELCLRPLSPETGTGSPATPWRVGVAQQLQPPNGSGYPG